MGFFIQWDKNSKPTDANSQSKSMDTSKQEWIRGYPLFASTHHKEDPQEEGMSECLISKNRKPNAPPVPFSSIWETARASAAFTCAGLQSLLHEGIQDSNSDTCGCAELHWNHLYGNCSLKKDKLLARKLYISQMQRLNFFRTEYWHKHWELAGLLVKITYKKFNLFSE